MDAKPLVYAVPERRQRDDISARELVAKVRERHPDFAPSAYLGGTEKPDSFKWLMTGRIGTKERISGYVGPKMMEAAQTLHHLWTGRYLAYADPKALTMGRSTMLGAALIDPQARKALSSWFSWVAGNPLRALETQYYQSIMFIQPIDVLADGRQNMCDGCPDITVDNGELVWSCRLEERFKYGQFLRTVPIRPGSEGRASQDGAGNDASPA